MPQIFAPIAAFIASIIGGTVARVLGTVGMGVLVLQGVEFGMDTLSNLIYTHFGEVGSDLFGLLGLAGFDVYIKLVISAHMGLIAFVTVAGSLKRFGFAATEGAG